MPILLKPTCHKYFIIKCLLKSNVARVILLTNCNDLMYFKANLVEAKTRSTNLACLLYFYLHISVWIFRTLFICFALHGLLQSICFRMFCFKHSITFENTYLLSYWFHCVDIFYIKFRFCETVTAINSVTRILLIEALYKFRTIKCWFTLQVHMHVLG